ncbi:MAG TPA: YdeI/OmpD-associated family protein [Terracidiphilus sp.]|nr:YdeI/OmpD-associated family protein [Terracidiphilus sp.]
MPTKSNSPRKSFTALLEPDGTALKWVIARVPFDIAKAWPVLNGRRVRGEIGGFAFRTSLFPDARRGGHILLVNKKMQAGSGSRVGSRVKIWLEPDLAERPVVLPSEFARILKATPELRRLFESMSPSMRREIGKWTGEPKSPATRQKRAEKLAERMMQAVEGEHDPPPVLRALFLRHPGSREGWFALTPNQRRSHLMGIFYYETAEARERRAMKAIEEALKAANRTRERESRRQSGHR